MFELEEIERIFKGWSSSPVEAVYLPNILQLANAYLEVHPQKKEAITEALQDAFGTKHGNTHRDFARFRLDFETSANIELELQHTPEAVTRIVFGNVATPPPAAPPPPGVQEQQFSVADLVRQRRDLKALRSPVTDASGERLAAQAENMVGWYNWMQAGAGALSTPAEDIQGNRDHFAYWLNRGGPAPTPQANMNCWEAVMMAAYLAGLVTVQKLRLIHAKATVSARGIKPNMIDLQGKPIPPVAADNTRYSRVLEEQLGGHRGVNITIQGATVMPRRGDLIFLGTMAAHVAISIGTDEFGKHRCMSLWHHNGGTYANIATEQMANAGVVKVLPCPFPL